MIPTRLRRPLWLAGNALGLATALFTWWQGDGGHFLLFAFLILGVAGEAVFRFLEAPRRAPYLGMLLAPLLLLHYSSVGDFRIRLACFVMLLYVLVLSCRGAEPRIRLLADVLPAGRAWMLSLLAFSLAAAALYAQGIHLSGDEPHYVMIAQSLVEDGDFDLKNNFEGKTYSSYMPVEIRFHGSAQEGRYHSFHLPGISFLLVPFYFLFKLLKGSVPGNLFFRLAAALINSFFALGLFLALRKQPASKEENSLFVFFLLTFPLLFHAVHLFPELPAAALIVFAYLFARDRRRYFLSGLFLAGVPWFHLKYSIPTLVLSLFIIAWIWRESPGSGTRLKRLAGFASMPMLSLALLSLYSRILYGSFDPRVISPERNFLAIPLKFKAETLLSFFLDQRDGLLVYAPLFLLAFLAFNKEVRKGVRDFALLAAMFASYILFHAYTTVRGAYSPAARPTLFVMWIMAIFIAAFRRRYRSGIMAAGFRWLAGLTMFATTWFFYYPQFLYQPVTREVSQRASSWLRFMSSEAIDLPALFPSFLKKANAAWLPNWIWLGMLAVGLTLFYARAFRPALRRAAQASLPILGLALLFLVCFFPHVRLQTRYSAHGLSFFCNSHNFVYRQKLSAFHVIAGPDYDLFVDLRNSKADELDLSFFNAESATIRVRNGKRTLLQLHGDRLGRIRLPLRELREFSLAGKRLVHIGLETAARGRNASFNLKLE
jgi:hypothetical protein